MNTTNALHVSAKSSNSDKLDGKGQVFHIIHGSFVDGYGIRTTVFLKGCPLRCLWCCNPEGQARHREIKFTPSQCDACGNCIGVCPANAIRPALKQGEVKVQIDRQLCTNCGKCIEACYKGALDYFGKCMSVDDLFDTVIKDEVYYRSSGGGVTIGGGEPTFQPFFTRALLKRCKENHVHSAVDTCGYTLTEEGIKVLEDADLLLFDLKGMDPEEHRQNTGVSNEPILKNLQRLDAIGKPIIIRMPIVPGYNDSNQGIEHAARFLAQLRSVERIDLLPYHEFGSIKHRQLGRAYDLHVQPVSQDRIGIIKDTLELQGLHVQVGG